MESIGFEIYKKDNAIDESFCDELVDFFENDDSKTYGGMLDGNHVFHNKYYKNSSEIFIDVKNYPDKYIKIYKKIHKQLKKDIENLMELSPGMRELIKKNNWDIIMSKIQKTKKGDVCYRPHIDNAGDPRTIERVLVFIYYLRTVEEGGGTGFPTHNNLVVNSVKGRLLFFPPYWPYIHEGLDPISSDKYILNGWIRLVLT